MKQFTDTTGHRWEFGITIGSVRRVKDLLSVDLLNMGAPVAGTEDDSGKPLPLVVCLTTDPEFFARVIFALVSNQPDAKDINETEFFERLGAEAFEASMNGLSEELNDFFLRSGRTTQARILETQLMLIVKSYEAATKKMETVDLDRAMDRATKQLEGTDLNRMIDSEIDARFGTNSGTSPASLESTLAR